MKKPYSYLFNLSNNKINLQLSTLLPYSINSFPAIHNEKLSQISLNFQYHEDKLLDGTLMTLIKLISAGFYPVFLWQMPLTNLQFPIMTIVD